MPRPQASFTLTQLHYFMRVADLGSMTEAAAELFVAQSAVSSSIATLEQTLGCTLFVRQRSRGVALTEQGRSFRVAASRILGAVDEALESLEPGALTGSLTAGCFTTLAPFWVPEVYERMHDAHPGLDLRIAEVTADDVEGLLTRRDLEAVLTYGFDYGRSVQFDPICDTPVYAALSADHPLARSAALSLSELADQPLILLDLGKSANYFLSLFREVHLTPQVRARFESYEVVRSMVARGHGYSLLNQRPQHDLSLDGNRVTMVPISDVRSLLQIGVATRAGDHLSSKGEVFVATCREVLSAGLSIAQHDVTFT